LNLRLHPYQQNAGNRCADGRSRRSSPTVEAEITKAKVSKWTVQAVM